MQTRVTLNCTLNPEHTPDLIGFLTENLPNVRRFDGCLSVKVYFDELKNEMLLEEKWDSKEHHHAYIAFIDGNGVLAKLRAFFTQAPTIKYLMLEYI